MPSDWLNSIWADYSWIGIGTFYSIGPVLLKQCQVLNETTYDIVTSEYFSGRFYLL